MTYPKNEKPWYALRENDRGWLITKMFRGEITEHTVTKDFHCDCFASSRETCRHREMVRLFKGKPSGTLYNYDQDIWQEPVNETVED